MSFRRELYRVREEDEDVERVESEETGVQLSQDLNHEPDFTQQHAIPVPGSPPSRSNMTELVEPWVRRRTKVVNDCIHGLIRMDPDAVLIMDTPEFQRLRELKQLGLSHFVYPCAVHTRFEHSLGTYHLSKAWVQHLRQEQPELDITAKDIKLVSIAGLCHDLGHGPFSHVFDNEVLRKLAQLERIDTTRTWSHEQMSCDLLEYLWDANGLEDWVDPDARDALSRRDLKVVQEIISMDKGDYDNNGCYVRREGRPRLHLGGKMYLYEIVANGRNSVDVDKFDYLLRDSAACNVKISFDHTRLVQLSKVIYDPVSQQDHICFKQKEAFWVYNLFNSRATMHQAVYTHAKAKAVEFMVTDAIVAADRHFQFNELIWSPATFRNLDDSLLRRIEWSDSDDLAESRAILKRLRLRDLYRYVGEFTVPDSLHSGWKQVTAQDIVNAAPPRSSLTTKDVIVDNREINYSMKARDPVNKVNFFDHLDSTVAGPLSKAQVSSLLPSVFQDKKVRAFVRDGSKLDEAVQALNNLARARNCTSPVGNTPLKRRRADLEEAHMLSGRSRVPPRSLLMGAGGSSGAGPSSHAAA